MTSKEQIIEQFGKQLIKPKSVLYVNDESKKSSGFDFNKAIQGMMESKQEELKLSEAEEKEKKKIVERIAAKRKSFLGELLRNGKCR